MTIQSSLAKRRTTIWRAAEAAECDGCLIFGTEGHSEAFRYLTDYEPFIGDCWLILTGTRDAVGVLTFGWSVEEAQARSGIDIWNASFDPVPLVLEQLKRHKIRRLATIGAERLPHPVFRSIGQLVDEADIVPLDDEISRLRRIKNDEELERLRAAADVTDHALSIVRERVEPGMTEIDVLGLIAGSIYGCGATLAFDPLIVSGREDAVVARASKPRILRDGDPIMLDLGAQVNGYQSDVARTYFIGSPSPEQRKAWDTVLRAYEAILSAVRPGVPCKDLNDVGWRVVREGGYAARHRMGHGVGLATSYEWPDLETESELLEPGMTLAIEPGVYLPGVGSVKLEDMIVVTASGYELLSHAERSPYLSETTSRPRQGKDAP